MEKVLVNSSVCLFLTPGFFLRLTLMWVHLLPNEENIYPGHDPKNTSFSPTISLAPSPLLLVFPNINTTAPTLLPPISKTPQSISHIRSSSAYKRRYICLPRYTTGNVSGTEYAWGEMKYVYFDTNTRYLSSISYRHRYGWIVLSGWGLVRWFGGGWLRWGFSCGGLTVLVEVWVGA